MKQLISGNYRNRKETSINQTEDYMIIYSGVHRNK